MPSSLRDNGSIVAHLYVTLLCFVLTASGCLVDEGGAKVSERTLAVHTVCAASNTTLDGIDVSKWQGTVDWSAVKSDGIAFAFARVSDGLTVPDATFSGNWSGMKQAGLIRGAYQFFRPGQDALAQADLLIQAIADAGGTDAADLPPVLDLETDGGLSASAVADKVAVWIARIEAALGRKPIIYSGSYFWDDQVSSAAYASYPLWTAHYTSEACPYVPDAWQAWTFWQYTDSGAVQGVNGNVDRNLFDGDAAALQAFIASSLLTPCVPTGPEICGDGLDNDCQDGVDDGCEDPACTVTGAEICDGEDNNCQGGVDDGDPGGGALCLLPALQGPCAWGVTRCSGGSIACEARTTPQTEQCNGVDDDCNGLVDDAAQGCGDVCVPQPERCNGVDDDCNGLVDDGDTESGQVCFAGADCLVGEAICRAGSLVCEARPQTEICDGIDNNCNGLVDDVAGGCAGTPAGTPACAPLAERCNGLDDDCDGLPDEGNPEGGGACSVQLGSEVFAGLLRCVRGQLVCSVESAAPYTPTPPTGQDRLTGGCAVGAAASPGEVFLLLVLLLGLISRRRPRRKRAPARGGHE